MNYTVITYSDRSDLQNSLLSPSTPLERSIHKLYTHLLPNGINYELYFDMLSFPDFYPVGYDVVYPSTFVFSHVDPVFEDTNTLDVTVLKSFKGVPSPSAIYDVIKSNDSSFSIPSLFFLTLPDILPDILKNILRKIFDFLPDFLKKFLSWLSKILGGFLLIFLIGLIIYRWFKK